MHKDPEVHAVEVLPEARTPERNQLRVQFFDATPQEQIIQATEIANVLSSVIEKQGLFSNIGGKKYIKAEGWQTLGTFLGVVPREKSVVRHDDGSYEAYVEIVKFRDGTIVGGGSALCSRKEKRWAGADEYAVRSMAITRATGKAFRVGFSWIVTLAGYSPTPEEEIPVPTVTEEPPKKEVRVYSGDATQRQALVGALKKHNISEDKYDLVHKRMIGLPSKELPRVIRELDTEIN